AARPTASSPGWLALVLAADGSVGLALRDPQYDELRRIAGQLARQAREMAGDTPQFVVLGIAQSQADAAVRRQHQGQPAGAARRRPRR
ncbi:hypothetical protein QM331_32440, partial [Pseudomonas aeruginosa]|uniref:hypothetical protein n=1 Tax=Pseudomonas aeruginosa TaxID=287 RepID=UPI0024BCB33D